MILLQGPFPFDPAAPTSSGAGALAEAEAVLRSGRPPIASSRKTPGLYVVWHVEEDTPAIAGFWLVQGPAFVKEGLDARRTDAPPYAADLLTAAVEAVWWETLRVWSGPEDSARASGRRRRAGLWHPLVVVEWPPALASRSDTPPPGVTPQLPKTIPEEELGGGPGWLDIGVQSRDATPVDVEEDEAPDDPGLPAVSKARSLLMVVRGELEFDRRAHRGTLTLVPPAWFPAPAEGGATSVDAWWAAATGTPPETPDEDDGDAPQRRGGALELPGGRVGYPLHGWLSPALALRPLHASAITEDVLRRRDVGSRVLSQASTALVITLSVLCGVVLAFELVERATKWRAEELPAPPERAPQPGLSICSADPQRFREELRCTLQTLSNNTASWGRGFCGDDTRGGVGTRTRSTQHDQSADLRATWCGLRDRQLDGEAVFTDGSADDITWAEVAASQACYNTLGHPYAYELPMGDGLYRDDAHRADPRLFLRSSETLLQGLRGVVQELDGACDDYRVRVEAQLAGAIFAEHIGQQGEAQESGGPTNEARQLRAELTKVAASSLDGDGARCFRAGVERGVADLANYEDLCGGIDAMDAKYDVGHAAWQALRGDSEGQHLLAEYVRARFTRWDDDGIARQEALADTPDLWKCHLTLSDQRPHLRAASSDTVPTRWGQRLPIPDRYGSGRAVQSQLPLDAALRTLEESPRMALGDCWPVVQERLARYDPVHPLLPERGNAPWPSSEQQVCGQLCAVHARIAESRSGDRWWTRGTDLAACVWKNQPVLEGDGVPGEAELERRLDRLHLPWNEEPGGAWREPTTADVCAFNLVAQGYATELGGALPPSVSPIQWAGDVDGSTGIAGGLEGLAVKAAEDMSSYGRARSRTTCANVATQCFTGAMVAVTAERTLLPNAARGEWESWVAGRDLDPQTPLQPLARQSPWCALIHPYTSPDGQLPEGELDYPCALGVQESRQRVSGLLRRLALGPAATGETP